MSTQENNGSRPLRVLVSWGTKLGGTEGIARIIGEALEREGLAVTAQRASDVRDVKAYDAAIIGGALYANRWHDDARRLVQRNVASLRHIPVWLFSSGPLDDSADSTDIPPAPQVGVLMDRIGACGHATFGGRLPADAKGFPAAAMAKTNSGDWRNPDKIRAWATDVARAIPTAKPSEPVDFPARSIPRLAAYGVAGWLQCMFVIGALWKIAPVGLVTAVHAVFAPMAFTVLAIRYFRARGAREPLPVALTWAAMVALLDAGLAVALQDLTMFRSFAATWLPFGLIFVATWITGFIISTMPWPKLPKRDDQSALRAT